MRKLMASLKEVRDGEEGVTLLELIVVCALLGVLVIIGIPLYGDIEQNTQQTVQLKVASNAATDVAIGILNGTPASLTLEELNARGDGYLYSDQPPTGVTAPALYNTTSDNVWIVAYRFASDGKLEDWAYAGNAIGSGDSWSGSVGAPGGGILLPGGGSGL